MLTLFLAIAAGGAVAVILAFIYWRLMVELKPLLDRGRQLLNRPAQAREPVEFPAAPWEPRLGPASILLRLPDLEPAAVSAYALDAPSSLPGSLPSPIFPGAQLNKAAELAACAARASRRYQGVPALQISAAPAHTRIFRPAKSVHVRLFADVNHIGASSLGWISPAFPCGRPVQSLAPCDSHLPRIGPTLSGGQPTELRVGTRVRLIP